MSKDPKVFERLLDDAEIRLDRLRALYEQWFQGLERLEPTIPRKNFDRFMEQLRRDRPRVTGLKFRYHNLVQRYTTYVMYWRKVARQIEEGTYRFKDPYHSSRGMMNVRMVGNYLFGLTTDNKEASDSYLKTIEAGLD